MRNFLFIILVTLLTSKLYSAEKELVYPIIAYKHLGEEEGLKSKTVYSIIQDKEGFLWFASDDGVFRYDGKNFRHYTVDDGLTDNEILQIYQDRKGRVWFLTLNGYLSYWHKGKIYNSTNAHFLKNAYLGFGATRIYEDRSGKLWIGCKMAGLIVIDDTLVRKIGVDYEYRDYATHFVYEDSKGDIWYFYKDIMINLSTNDSIKLPANVIYVPPFDSKQNAIILLDGFYSFPDGKLGDKFTLQGMPVQNKISNILIYGNDMWVCTFGEGCLLFREGKLLKRYLENSSVTSVTVDREGNKWFSTINEGVYFLTQNAEDIRHYTNNSGLSAEKVISIAIDGQKSLWLGYNNGVIENIKGNIKTSFRLQTKNDREFIRITSLMYRNDTVWCGSDVGIHYITNNKLYRIPYFNHNALTDPYAIKHLFTYDSNNLYAAYSLNFLKVEKVNGELTAVPLLDSIVRTFSSIRLPDNKILVSTSSGLKVYSAEIFESYLTDSILSNLRALDMELDTDNLLIISTNDKGLYFLKDKKIYQHISVKDGLSGNNCRKILLDRNFLYVSTASGVSILKKSDGKWKIQNILTTQNGLLSNSTNDLQVNSHNIYIATDKGVSIIPKNTFSSGLFPGRVSITEIITNDTTSVLDSVYSFSSEIPRLLLRFSYPIYNPLNKLAIKYRLTGGSATGEWNRTNNTEVEFSTLAPGNYLFQIKPDDNSAVTNAASLYINIIPKWWQTSLAKFGFVLIASILIVYYFRRRVKLQYENKLIILKNERLIESERNRIASDMHDDIGADLTQISMWMNILNDQQEKDKGIIKKVKHLSNDVLTKMDQIIWALNSVNNNPNDLLSYIRSYASECLESSSIRLCYKIEGDVSETQVSSIQRRNVFLVLKELLHNSIKYSKASDVTIIASKRKDILDIYYSDNGTGFDINQTSEGLGLQTMKNRIEEINSKIEFITSPGRGFQCRLMIKLNNRIEAN